jgi:hypothetical protein
MDLSVDENAKHEAPRFVACMSDLTPDDLDYKRAIERLTSSEVAPILQTALVLTDVLRVVTRAFNHVNHALVDDLHAQGIMLRRASADADSGVSAAPTTPTRSTSHEAVDHSDYDPDPDEDATSNDTHTSAANGCNTTHDLIAAAVKHRTPTS